MEGSVYSHNKNTEFSSSYNYSTVSLYLLRLSCCSQALICLLSRRKGHCCPRPVEALWSVALFRPSLQLARAFIGMRCLLEGGVFSRQPCCWGIDSLVPRLSRAPARKDNLDKIGRFLGCADSARSCDIAFATPS